MMGSDTPLVLEKGLCVFTYTEVCRRMGSGMELTLGDHFPSTGVVEFVFVSQCLPSSIRVSRERWRRDRLAPTLENWSISSR